MPYIITGQDYTEDYTENYTEDYTALHSTALH